MRAAYADGRVWLLSDAGVLSSVTEGQNGRVLETLPDRALDLCVADGHPAVISGTDSGWKLWTRLQNSWSVATTIPADGDRFRAMQCAPAGITLLTTRRLIDIDATGQRSINLSGQLRPGRITSIYAATNEIFVGINAGEWGGGLHQIARRSGQIASVERNETAELCSGPLNTDCDPVNAIAPEPWRPDCVIAAVGLVHFAPHGRLVEICGNEVRRLYSKPFGNNRSAATGTDNDSFGSVAFFGLGADGTYLWAVGLDGIYRIGRDGTANVISMPKFRDFQGIKISFDLPKFVLVLTDVNQRLSVSGAVPLLVPR